MYLFPYIVCWQFSFLFDSEKCVNFLNFPLAPNEDAIVINGS